MATGSDTGFAATFRGDTSTINGARRRVGTWLAGRHCPAADVEVVQLIVSELASNAIEASGPDPYDITASLRDHQFELAVTNRTLNADIPSPDSWGPSTVLAPRGRGLAIVAALADDVEVAVDNGLVCVTVSLCLGVAN